MCNLRNKENMKGDVRYKKCKKREQKTKNKIIKEINKQRDKDGESLRGWD